jgi:ADP-ribosylglycohydrolase
MTHCPIELLRIAYDSQLMKIFGDAFQSWPATPIPNSYWVEPGRFLAGEYPGITRLEASGRVSALLDAGINSFIDLTGEGELSPYHLDLGRNAVHRRFPILDHGLPDSPATIDSVVATIDADLAAGRRIYLHCRAGIGRTGLAVGCYLIHRGLEGPAALEKLQELWQRCSRARSWPRVPETEEQVRYVREWMAPRARAATDPSLRIEGALLGLAIGDALGHLTAEHRFSDAAWLAEAKRIGQLTTGADAAMTIAAAESLLSKDGHDAHDQLSRYVAWSQQPGAQLRMPAELKRVLATWQWSRKSNPGSHDPKNLDAHPLARTLAPALFVNGDVYKAAALAADVSRTTLQSPLVLDVVRIWAATLVSALSGQAKTDILSMRTAREVMHGRQVKPQIGALLDGKWTLSEPVGGAVSTVAKALDVFRVTSSFDAAIREAARASPSCAALVGSLAGAHYGPRSIPPEWSRALNVAPVLSALARRFGK